MVGIFSTPPKPEPSYDSQSTASVSGNVTVPNPTPLTEAMDGEAIDPPPDIDFHAMVSILAPIAEGLNEAAEDAMFPTPPINTPAVTSPATSVVHRHPHVRSRGLSTIADRLARAKLEDHRFGTDTDLVTPSNHSVCSSMPAENESDSISQSDILSDGGRNDIPIGLGSPRPNHVGLISFSVNDLTNRPPVPFNSMEASKDSSNAAVIGSGSHHPGSATSFASGVTEMSTWREEVEGDFERAVKSLENLAYDEHKLDPSKPVEHYHQARLQRLLCGAHCKIPVSVGLVDKKDFV